MVEGPTYLSNLFYLRSEVAVSFMKQQISDIENELKVQYTTKSSCPLPKVSLVELRDNYQILEERPIPRSEACGKSCLAYGCDL